MTGSETGAFTKNLRGEIALIIAEELAGMAIILP